jgi:hypothetical protein
MHTEFMPIQLYTPACPQIKIKYNLMKNKNKTKK